MEENYANNDVDALLRIVNDAQRQKIVDRTIVHSGSSEEARTSVEGKKETNKNKIAASKRFLIAGGIVVALAAGSLGIDIGSRLQKSIIIKGKYEVELEAAREKLIDNGLAFLNDDEELIIEKKTSVRDYANIATSNFTFVDASCYYDLIGYQEMNKLVQNLEISNDKGHYYTDFNQYCRINGIIDSNGYPDYSMLYNLAKGEISQLLNNSTLINEQETYYDTDISSGRSH